MMYYLAIILRTLTYTLAHTRRLIGIDRTVSSNTGGNVQFVSGYRDN